MKERVPRVIKQGPISLLFKSRKDLDLWDSGRTTVRGIVLLPGSHVIPREPRLD